MACPSGHGGGSLVEDTGTALETEQRGQGLDGEQAYSDESAELRGAVRAR